MGSSREGLGETSVYFPKKLLILEDARGGWHAEENTLEALVLERARMGDRKARDGRGSERGVLHARERGSPWTAAPRLLRPAWARHTGGGWASCSIGLLERRRNLATANV